MSHPNNVVAERAILSGLWHGGSDVYYDIVDMIQPSTFTVDTNADIFFLIKELYKIDDTIRLDIPTIQSAAQTHKKKIPLDFLRAIIGLSVSNTNVRKFAAQIRKLEVARLLRTQLDEAQNKLLTISGDEPIIQILRMAEDAVLDFTSLLNNNDSVPNKLGDNLVEYLNHLAEHPVEQLGISTGYPLYDTAIGGGLRDATVNIIAARPKIGKTVVSDNVGYHIASNIGIPVLNMDTEMLREDHICRTLAMITSIDINDIETGKVNINNSTILNDAYKKLQNVPYYHKSIAGMPFEDQLAVIRRWIMKEVGLNPDGTAKTCVIIYDYLKLMDATGISADLKEYQLLGFMMTSLHNFATRYKIPILAFMQLNRDGIKQETTGTASGSDRIIWLCSNFSIFKKKSDEEIAQDGVKNGNRKLVVVATRHGGGLDEQDYINFQFDGRYARCKEGKTRSELQRDTNDKNEGFIVDNDSIEDIPFGDD